MKAQQRSIKPIHPQPEDQHDDLSQSIHPLAQPQYVNNCPFTSKEILQALDRGEDGDAHLMAQLFKDKYVFDHAGQRWYIFKGPVW